MDIDMMLYKDAMYLVGFAKNNPTFQFIDMARSFQLRQEDWTNFWKELRK